MTTSPQNAQNSKIHNRLADIADLSIMGTKRAAELTGLSKNYIAALCRKGAIKATQDAVGSPWKIHIDDLNDWLERSGRKRVTL